MNKIISLNSFASLNIQSEKITKLEMKRRKNFNKTFVNIKSWRDIKKISTYNETLLLFWCQRKAF